MENSIEKIRYLESLQRQLLSQIVNSSLIKAGFAFVCFLSKVFWLQVWCVIMAGFLIQEGTATTLLQGSIFVHRLNTFKHMLKEGAVYKLSRFDVT